VISDQAQPNHRLDKERRFIMELYDRLGISFDEQGNEKGTSDRGAKASFKRALSGEPTHVLKIYEFLPYIVETSEWREKKIWIPVACLSVFYPQLNSEQYKNFGYSCWLLQKEIQRDSPDAKGISRRFRALLDIALEDLQTPLTALVRQMKSKGIAINYPQLLADLRQWEHPNQYIQDRWARAFWGAPSGSADEAEPAAETPLNSNG